MPTYSVQCGVSGGRPKCQVDSLSGCHTRRTSVLMTGAVAKISGATYSRGPLNSKVAKMTHRAPRAPAVPASEANVTPLAVNAGIVPRYQRMPMGNKMAIGTYAAPTQRNDA